MNTEAVAAARAVMAAHIAALNARDEAALAATLHFPHYRLSEGRLRVWETPDSYLADFRSRAGANWARSGWAALTPVQAAPDKVHLAVTVERFDRTDRLIARFESLWVIARLKGRWAAQLRSSFAPDTTLAAGASPAE
jgi:hypothetical protein